MASFQKQTATTTAAGTATVAQHGNSNRDAAFSRLPVLSLAAARAPETKPAFLAELRLALLHVGFLYLADTGLPDELVARVSEQTRLFFDETVLPLREKERIEMKNEKSFLGWSRVRTFACLSWIVWRVFELCISSMVLHGRC
jgi:hypothetical protein